PTTQGHLPPPSGPPRTAARAPASPDPAPSAGLRDADGTLASSVLTEEAGFSEDVPEELPVPSEDSIDELTRSWKQLKMDSRVLTIVDISGSMLAEVPGTGMARMQATGAAASEGLQMFSSSSELGDRKSTRLN